MVENELVEVFSKLDFYQKSSISYSQFTAGCIHREKGVITEEKIRAVFDIWDVDRDGRISASDLSSIVHIQYPLLKDTRFFLSLVQTVESIPMVASRDEV